MILISAFFFIACNSVFKDNNPYYKISNSFKDYCFFDVGSHWIYKNDSTGSTFNLTVKKVNAYVGFHPMDVVSAAYSFDAIEWYLTL